MSRLSEMIKELCPDGVEYRKLKEIFDTRNGYTPSKSNDSYWENGTIPWFRMEDIRENGHILSDSIQHVNSKAIKGDLFPANSIIVATSATIGEHALITVPSLANQRFTYLILKHEFTGVFDIKFLFYYCYKLDLWCLSHLNQGSFPSVDMKQFAQFEIPVPPLPIQNEIVKMLDNFTELTAELTAELVLRKKQYNFYRDSLLNFVRVDDTIVQTDRQTDRQTALRIGKIWWLKQSIEVEWKTLGEVCDLIAGGDVPKGEFSQVVTEEYRIPIYSNGIGEKALYGFTKSPRITQPCVTISARGTIGYSALHLTPFYPVVRLIAAIPYKCLDVKYLFYMLQMTTFKIPQTGIPQLTIPMVKTYSIPIPPLDVQQKIVSILDRFDTLCNDLTQGLPAEIAARKKQYEYYRDKLLTFRRKGA